MGLLDSLQSFAGSSLGAFTGGIAGDLFSAKQSRRNAKRQMAFQREMSGTAHQREVNDLRLAGLNPILSGTGGAGSTSPGGAMGVVPPMGSTALAGMRIRAEIDNIKALTSLTKTKEGAIKPVSDIGKGLGAITTPLAEAFAQVVEELPSSAVSVKRQLNKAQETVLDYLFKKRHKNPVFHKRGELNR